MCTGYMHFTSHPLGHTPYSRLPLRSSHHPLTAQLGMCWRWQYDQVSAYPPPQTLTWEKSCYKNRSTHTGIPCAPLTLFCFLCQSFVFLNGKDNMLLCFLNLLLYEFRHSRSQHSPKSLIDCLQLAVHFACLVALHRLPLFFVACTSSTLTSRVIRRFLSPDSMA